MSRFVRFKVGDMALTKTTAETGPRQSHRCAAMAKYQRILLKLSGEVMAGAGSFGIDPSAVAALAEEVAEVARAGVQIGLVVGGGNFFRGVAAAAQNMDRVTADHMGMLATVINALALQDALEKAGVPTRVMTAIEMHAGGRALHPAPGHSPSGKGPHRDVRRRAPRIRIFPPTRRRRCAAWRFTPMSSPRPRASTACTTRIRWRIPMRVLFPEIGYLRRAGEEPAA